MGGNGVVEGGVERRGVLLYEGRLNLAGKSGGGGGEEERGYMHGDFAMGILRSMGNELNDK